MQTVTDYALRNHKEVSGSLKLLVLFRISDPLYLRICDISVD